jgi:F-type H+-transporting ATPase subunit delta
MSNTTIATRYAKSLLDLGVEKNKLDKILEDMHLFEEAISNRDFYLLLKSPIVKNDKKIKIFKELFDGKVDKITLAFMNILSRKGRENLLPEITREFFNQYKKLKHITTVKVTSATTLSKKQLAMLKEKLEKSEETDENIEMVTLVDKNLIGGIIVEIGDKMYNASIAHKLQILKKDFEDNKFVKSF